MSYVSGRRSESSASRRSIDGDTNEDSERDETKRRSRNLSEKKRRDQFNILINELSTMVTSTTRKMDKSTVLKVTISFLKAHNEVSAQSVVQESSGNWKPSFLSNEEFIYLMLEALDGFILVLSCTGKIIYVSESVTSLLGYLPSDLIRNPIYDFILPEERSNLCNLLNGGKIDEKSNLSKPHHSTIDLNMRLGGMEMKQEDQKYHLVRLSGYMKLWISRDCVSDEFEVNEDENDILDPPMTKTVFVSTGRLVNAQLLREISVVVDASNTEFSSRHSLEWKFLFLDHRAPPIIGYLPFEVLGTSGYDYYHMDDLGKVATCHEALMQNGEGTSCYYRFLTKGQQWVWLQTRYYITYHQWNSKPEFIVGTHRVVSYADVMTDLRAEISAPFSRFSNVALSRHSKVESMSKPIGSSTFLLKSGIKDRPTDPLTFGHQVGVKRPTHSPKFELPPKFVPTISLGIPITQPIMSPTTPIVETITGYRTSINSTGSTSLPLLPQLPLNTQVQNKGISITLQTQVATFLQPSALASPQAPPIPTVGLPLTTFNVNPVLPTSTFALATSSAIQNTLGGSTILAQSNPNEVLLSSAQSALQEQLLTKHAELQRHIIQQQEELRRVSEQLLMSQCGIIPTESSVLIQPTSSTNVSHQNLQSIEEDNSLHLQQRYLGLLYPQLTPPTGLDFQIHSPHHQSQDHM